MSGEVIKKDVFERLYAAMPTGERDPHYSSMQTRIDELERELEQVRSQSDKRVKTACAKAKEDAVSTARREFGNATEALGKATQELQRVADAQLQVVQSEIVELAVRIAQKIVRRELRGDEEYLPRLVRRCLKKIVSRASVRIRVNPIEAPRLLEIQESMVPDAGTIPELTVVADRRVESGGCVVETPEFVVDGTPRSQLALARQALRGEFE